LGDGVGAVGANGATLVEDGRMLFCAGLLLVAVSLLAHPLEVSAAPFAYVPNIQGDSVSVIDTANKSVVQTIPAGMDLLGISIDPTGTTAYIGSYSGTVGLLDLSSRAFVGLISVGSAPREIAFAPGSSLAYVTDQSLNEIFALDTATGNVVGSPIPVGPSPTQIAISSADIAYVVNNASASGFVSVIDLRVGSVVATVPVGGFPNGLALHRSLPIIYVANQCGDVGDCAQGSISVIDTTTRLVTSTIQTHQGATQFVAFTPDGTLAYASNTTSHTVSVIDVGTAAVVGAPIAVGFYPAAIAFTPDGGFAYVINQCDDPSCASGSASVIDTATRTVTATIPLGWHPAFIAMEGTCPGESTCGSPAPTTVTSTSLPGCVPDTRCDDGDPCTIDGCQTDGCHHDPATGIEAATCVFSGEGLQASLCGGERIPEGIVHALGDARTFAERAAVVSKPRKARSLVKKELGKLRLTGRRLRKLHIGQVSDACFVELKAILGAAEAGATTALVSK
jgi:YVTN family beta-propeller protein